MAGTQDNGTLVQETAGGATWDHPGFGDGGDVVIDDVSLAASGESIRYFSSQDLFGWQRQVYDSANNLVSTTSLASISDGLFLTPVALNKVDPMRLLVGGSGHIYESTNQGTSLTSIANIGVNEGAFDGGHEMMYGGIKGGVDNPDLVYAASGADVVKQTTAGGGFTNTSPGGGGADIRGITDDPTDWATIFSIDDNQVFESTDAGGTWDDVTGNLASISAADFRSIEYVHGTLGDALVVGTISGIFDAKLSDLGGAAAWSTFGDNLPDVIVYDLEYDATDNVLVAGTMGRGAWLVNDVTTNLGIGAVACYCRGTRVLTPAGEVAVEELAIGDWVVTLSGGFRPIRWIGRRAYTGRFIAENREVLPIRIIAGALSEGVPARDLALSPEHSLCIDGVLVQSKHLVNGMTIVQAKDVEEVEYFHIELDNHDVLFAEGAAAETYVDCDNRLMFANGAEFAALYPDDLGQRWEFCRERLESGSEQLTEIRNALLWRAQGLGYDLDRDPDLLLIVDGESIRPDATDADCYCFTVPGGSEAVWLASRSAVPAEVVAASADIRRLGVPVERIRLYGADLSLEALHGHPDLRDGFHEDEPTHRWTEGFGRLPKGWLQLFPGAFTLEVKLAATALPYWRVATEKPAAVA
jgi:hypothetical protein